MDALGERMDAAELKITPDATVSTVTDSAQNNDDMAAAYSVGGGVEFVMETQTATTASWKGNVSFFELKDGTITGAISCYYSQQSRLSTQYASGMRSV